MTTARRFDEIILRYYTDRFKYIVNNEPLQATQAATCTIHFWCVLLQVHLHYIGGLHCTVHIVPYTFAYVCTWHRSYNYNVKTCSINYPLKMDWSMIAIECAFSLRFSWMATINSKHSGHTLFSLQASNKGWMLTFRLEKKVLYFRRCVPPRRVLGSEHCQLNWNHYRANYTYRRFRWIRL